MTRSLIVIYAGAMHGFSCSTLPHVDQWHDDKIARGEKEIGRVRKKNLAIDFRFFLKVL